MASYPVRPRCGPSRQELPPLKQFRCTRPTIKTTDGTRWTPETFRERPLNRLPLKRLKEAEIREQLRDPLKDVDPYERLEFFKPGDLDPPQDRQQVSTAMPVEQPGVVRATEARKYLIQRLDQYHIAGLRKMLSTGQLTEEEIDEMKAYFKETQNDSELAFAIDAAVNADSSFCVEYPTEADKLVDQRQMQFLEQLRFNYNIPGYVEFEEIQLNGDAQVPVVRLSHCNGDQAVISLHGGCLYSWTTVSSKDHLFQNPSDIFDGEKPIQSSGISLAFPRVGKVDALPYDGFANRLLWDVVHSEVGADWLPDPAPSVTLYCKDTAETRKLWPHSFEMYYKITLGESDEAESELAPTKEQRKFLDQVEQHGTLKATKAALKAAEAEMAEAQESAGQRRFRGRGKKSSTDGKDAEEADTQKSKPPPTQLRLQLTVRNTGDAPMEFTIACRTHLQQRGLRNYGKFVRILGLGGRYYLDYTLVPGKPVLRLWDEDYLTLGDRDMGWDAIFTENTMNDVFYTPGRLEYYESITRQGFPDLLLVQPGIHHPDDHALADHVTMLGRGRVTVPAQLKPGEKWEGEYVLRHHDVYFEEPMFGYQGELPPPDESKIQTPTLESQEILTDVQS